MHPGLDEHHVPLDLLQFYPQSEQIEEIVSFIDESKVLTGSQAGNHAFSVGDGTIDTELGNFLKRPVRINSFTWLESDTKGIKTTISPWNLWANESTVKNKLNNYSFIRGDLHVKFVFSASPFYYGRLMATYQPLPSFTPSTIALDAGLRWLILNSQRPHVDLDPQCQESVEMILPMIWHKNWINVQSAQDFTDVGTLYYIIYSILESANSASGTGVTITTYAWLENAQLSGASAGYAMQSDEYGDGCVSRPASQIASAATYFEKIPIIGPFATATKIGASAVSLIAKIFGFTNVPVIADSIPQRPEPFPKMATTEIGYPIEKLTLDSKNELSIDPKIIGRSSNVDELSINYLASRESYLCTSRWTSSNLIDDVLFYSRVNPRLYDSDGATQAKVYMTPMAWLSNLFDHWRGDIIFRFRIVCSKYHKGRLRISFDPTGYDAQNIGNTIATSNVVHTAIVDIGETTDVEFRIPYQQATQFLALRPNLQDAQEGWAVNTAVPVTYPYSPFYDNGFLTVRVLNILTAPVASTGIDVLVYVRAATNIEFANPTEIDNASTLSYFAPQADIEYDTGEDKVVLGVTKDPQAEQYLVHFGENIKSLRQVLRRMTWLSSNYFNMPTAGISQMSRCLKTFYRQPICPGFQSNGAESAVKIVGTGNSPYNFCNFTPLAWIMPAFVCYRGSVNWSFNVVCPTGVVLNEMRASRDNVNGATAAYSVTAINTTTVSQVARNMQLLRTGGATGQAITNCLTNSGLNIQCPNYCVFKFQSTNPALANLGSVNDGSLLDQMRLELLVKTNAAEAAKQIVLNNYIGIGTDFSLYHFLNVPTLYIYSTFPLDA